jgi:phenolic acid decarboxylase
LRQLAFLSLIAVGISACENSTAPVPAGSGPQFAISDGVHTAGNAHFFFLPPMVSDPTVSGTFDPNVDATVQICVWNGTTCGTTVATYGRTTGSDGQVISVDPAAEAYMVRWRTRNFPVLAGTIYRIRVLAGVQELGFADVQVVVSNGEARNVNSNEFIPLLDNHILVIRFRIEQGAIFPPGPFAIAIDATALSAPSITLTGQSTFPTAAIQNVVLAEGNYTLIYNAGASQPSVTFTVTNAGTVDYATALDGVLSGRGTSTLLVNGKTVQIDASSLSAPTFDVNYIRSAVPSGAAISLTLLPGDHAVLYNAGASQPSVTFTVINAGTVDYATALDGVLSGRGTSTLLVNGRTVQIDASSLSAPTFDVNYIRAAVPSSAAISLTLLPGDHAVLYNAGASQPSVTFTVTNAGTVDYAAALDGVLSGRGTSTLLVNGRTIQVNSASTYQVSYVGTFAASSSVTLLPGAHGVVAGSCQFTFSIMSDGTLSYNASLYPYLTGAGTATLGIGSCP